MKSKNHINFWRVEPERFDEAIEHVFKENAKYYSTRIQRKEAPFNIVAKQYGARSILWRRIQSFITRSMMKIEKNKLDVVSKPRNQYPNRKGKKLFEAIVSTRPEVN